MRKLKFGKFYNILGLVALSSWGSGVSYGEGAKLIHLGWDQPTTAFVRDHWQELEASAPFDGVTVTAEFSHEGVTHEDHGVMLEEKWPRESLKTALENLRSAKFSRLKNNFLRVNSPPTYVDWFDDGKWDAVCANVANMAWLAKEAGFKGICFDPEQYQSKQYTWMADKGHSFEETSAMARKRGAQLMSAIVAEYPDITVWSLWLFAKTLVFTEKENISKVLAGIDYGLWPAFINGWLDALPPGARLVEGMEDAYYFQNLGEFGDAYGALKNVDGPLLKNLLAPENRIKYQTQVSVSYGIYLDAFLDDASSSYYLGALRGGSRIDRLRQTLRTALDLADDYVWLYGEQVRWWPINTPTWQKGGRFLTAASARPGKGQLAEDAFPGITKSVNLARDPAGTVAQILKEAGKEALPNLLGQSDFSKLEGAENAAEGWWKWEREDSKGTIEMNGKGEVCFSKVLNGVLAQNVSVKVGKVYAFEVWMKQVGAGHGGVDVRWQTADAKWTAMVKTRAFEAEAKATNDGWQKISSVVTAPAGVSRLVFLLSATNQKTAEDKICFKDPRLYEVP